MYIPSRRLVLLLYMNVNVNMVFKWLLYHIATVHDGITLKQPLAITIYIVKDITLLVSIYSVTKA